MNYDVFISHSSKDKPFAKSLHQHLTDLGLISWIDDEKLHGGDNWKGDIVKALESSIAMVLVYSRNCIDSEHVMKELNVATLNKLLIIPVRIEDIKPEGTFAYDISGSSWLSIFEHQQEKLQEIAESIKVAVDKRKHQIQQNESRPEISVIHTQEERLDVLTQIEKETVSATEVEKPDVSWPAVGSNFLEAISKELDAARLPFTPIENGYDETNWLTYWSINDIHYISVWLDAKGRRAEKVGVFWGYYSGYPKRDPAFREACDSISNIQDALDENGNFRLNGYEYKFVSDDYLGFETSERPTFEEMTQGAFVKKIADQLVAFSRKIWPVVSGVPIQIEKETVSAVVAEKPDVSWPAVGSNFLEAIYKELDVTRLPFPPIESAYDETMYRTYWQINKNRSVCVWLDPRSSKLGKVTTYWGYYSEYEKRDPAFRETCDAISDIRDALDENGNFCLEGYEYKFVSNGYLGFETSERPTLEEMTQGAFVKKIADQLVAFSQKIWPVVSLNESSSVQE